LPIKVGEEPFFNYLGICLQKNGGTEKADSKHRNFSKGACAFKQDAAIDTYAQGIDFLLKEDSVILFYNFVIGFRQEFLILYNKFNRKAVTDSGSLPTLTS